MRSIKEDPDHVCLSCGDPLPYLSTGYYVGLAHTDKPGFRCAECADELETGVVTNQNIHIVGAPSTPKVNALQYNWESE